MLSKDIVVGIKNISCRNKEGFGLQNKSKEGDWSLQEDKEIKLGA